MHNPRRTPASYSALRAPRFALLGFLLATGPWFLAPGACPAQDDPFAAGVRTTPWLSPDDEQKAFKLPPGFEINLVAAEPEIQKPLNMAFDEKGRIWLTNTIEYPYAAPPDRPGKDTIKVLEDTDGDGRFEKVTTFADGLNIPMGIYPWKGGCVAFSIPNLWHFEDTDADGVCDKRTVLYGPFDTSRDTHGMINSLRRGWDGWVYACHGFNNDSRVRGKDGHEIHMQSGNVFRFQLDGSRIEHFTHGQVNPFGMCFDELFNIFTADCHSKPVYQLLRGGYYPSFGKPHDGLGFVPPMMDHTHGSTAICGLVKYSGENFPTEYRGDFYSGNVMTSRINRNKPQYHGSTIKAIEQPDFLTADDPWFRPVDLQIGPDGAMYIADFYNRIIGHYEVPLPHPGRDRTSGRIWRVAYKTPLPLGEGGRGTPRPGEGLQRSPDLSSFTNDQLLEHLAAHPDDPRALSLLRNRGQDALPDIRAAWGKPYSQRIIGEILWLLEANGALTSDDFIRAEFRGSPRDMAQAMKILAERKEWSESDRKLAVRHLRLSNPFVIRAAADALGRHPRPEQIRELFAPVAPAVDSHLRHTLRMALRDHIAALPGIDELDDLKLSVSQLREVASVCLAVPAPIAAAILTRYVDRHGDNTLAYLQHAARYATDDLIPELARIGEGKAGNDIELQAQVIQSLASGMRQRDGANFVQLELWAHEVVSKLLTANTDKTMPWTVHPIDGLPPSENPWVVATRPSRDGDKESSFFSSLPMGEQRTGIYRCAAFEIPEKISFWCAGHSGYPNQPLNDGNYVRLRDAATHELLMESRPPRNDTARQVNWDLSKHAGKQGYIDLVDGDTANAYAWLAVGRFSMDGLNPGNAPKRQQLAAEIIGKLKLTAFRPQLSTLITSPQTDGGARVAIGQAIVALEPDSRAAALIAVLNDPAIPVELRPRMGYAITVRNDEEYLDNLREVMKRVPTRLQGTLADTLAGDLAGAGALLALLESGHAAPRLLLLPNVSSKLKALQNEAVDARLSSITSKLPPANAVLDALITDRRRAFARATTNQERGEAVFTKHCAACHQLDGKGTVLGPQLDGIGNRGIDRLLEDILDPNRNVDVAFRTTTLRLTDGRVVSGLVRRDEGSQLVLADPQGKEFSVPKTEIDVQQKTDLSLMPANVSEIVSAEEFFDLVGYLLTKRVAGRTPTAN